MKELIKKISKQVVTNTYECDECGEIGDITNMMHLSGRGIIHAECFKRS